VSTLFFRQIVTQSVIGELLGGPIGGIAIDAAEGLLGKIWGWIFGSEDPRLEEILESLNQVQDTLNEIQDKENEILNQINVLNLDIQKRLIDEKLKNSLSIIDGLFDDYFAYLHAIIDGLYRQDLIQRNNEANLLSESIRRDIHTATERINSGVFDYLNILLSDLAAKRASVFETQLTIAYSYNKFDHAYRKARILLSFAVRTCKYLEGALNNTAVFQRNLDTWVQNNFITSWSSAFSHLQDERLFYVNSWTGIRSRGYTTCLQFSDETYSKIKMSITTPQSSCQGQIILHRAKDFDTLKNPAVRIYYVSSGYGFLAWDKNNIVVKNGDECDAGTQCDWYPFYAQNKVYSDMSDQLNYVYFGYKDSIDSGVWEVLDMRDADKFATVKPLSSSSDTQLFTISPQPGLRSLTIPNRYYFIQFQDAKDIGLSNDETSPLLQLNYISSTSAINKSIPDRWLIYRTSKGVYLIINRYTNNALSTRNGQLYLAPLLAKASNGYYNKTVDTDFIVQDWSLTGSGSDLPQSEWPFLFQGAYMTLSQDDRINFGKNNSLTVASDRNGTIHLNSAFFPSTKLSLKPTKPKSSAQRFSVAGGYADYALSSNPTNVDINYTIDPWNYGRYSINNTALTNGAISITRREKSYDSKSFWQFKQRPQGANVFWITPDKGTTCLTMGSTSVSLSSCSTNTNQLWVVNAEASYDSLAYTIKSYNTPTKSLIYDDSVALKIASTSTTSSPYNLFRILSVTR